MLYCYRHSDHHHFSLLRKNPMIFDDCPEFALYNPTLFLLQLHSVCPGRRKTTLPSENLHMVLGFSAAMLQVQNPNQNHLQNRGKLLPSIIPRHLTIAFCTASVSLCATSDEISRSKMMNPYFLPQDSYCRFNLTWPSCSCYKAVFRLRKRYFRGEKGDIVSPIMY